MPQSSMGLMQTNTGIVCAWVQQGRSQERRQKDFQDPQDQNVLYKMLSPRNNMETLPVIPQI